MHNSFWNMECCEKACTCCFSPCTVAGYIGKHKFSSGQVSQQTYAIEHEGHYYPARHDAVFGALSDAATRRRVRSQTAKRYPTARSK